MAISRKGSKKSKGVSINFDGVEAGGRSLADGQYPAVVDGPPELKTSESGNPYLAWVFKVDSGKYKGRKVWHNTSLQPQALWNLRNLLEAMGIEVPEGDMDLELDEFDGEAVGIDVVNEKYEGKDRPRVSEFIPIEDVGDSTDDTDGEEEEEEEEEAPPPKSRKGKQKPDPEPEEDEEEDEEEEAPPPKRTRKAKAKAPEFTKGQKVSFEDDGEEVVGKIIELEDEVATVKVGKELYEVELTDLTAE